METMNKRLDSILEGQKKLEEKNMNLQQENAKLKSQLERKTVQTRRRSTRSSSKQSNVEIPNDLRKRFRFIYKRMVAKGLTQGFIVDESPDSERNQALYEKIKGILKKEHGGENCQWTDLQMEGLFLSNTIYLRKNPEFVKHSIHSKFYCRLDTLTL
ncbi:PREDICTED: uncharacterized protein LOC107328959 [Acropora digitifera]|uniref:uncharacterized protein LOC107328959 n=1 Tax=Acropora digitifera TaxID=70779 RepID=UPI00077A35C0|nr:PREDICTED: uncharacterized protein LOC107328959 [Acropora digitifera]